MARHDEIQNFVPEAFWAVDATLVPVGGGGGGGGAARGWVGAAQPIKFDWHRGRLFNQAVAALYVHRIRARPLGNKVQKVKVTTKRKPRPTPLNTVELLKVASRNLGIGYVACAVGAAHAEKNICVSPSGGATARCHAGRVLVFLPTVRQHVCL